jgi:tRNA-modifying protein YgfZ
MPISPTPSPAETIFVDGADAGSFLQNQFSSDVLRLVPMHWQFSAWLDAQGRVRALVQLARLSEQRWLLLLRGGDATSIAHELRRYVFRAKLTLQPGANLVLGSAAAAALHSVTMQDGDYVLGCGDHAVRITTDTDAAIEDDTDRRLAEIRLGWPWLPDDALGQWIAPSLALQRLGAIAMDKGCYPGQEIVARLHYRGGNKRHLYRLQLSHRVVPGTRQEHAADTRGIQWLNVVATHDGAEALAVIGDEVAAEFASTEPMVFADGLHARIVQSWLS